jgi:hypothetical protein
MSMIRRSIGGLILASLFLGGCAGWPCPGPAAIMAERRAKAEADARARGEAVPPAAPAAAAATAPQASTGAPIPAGPSERPGIKP